MKEEEEKFDIIENKVTPLPFKQTAILMIATMSEGLTTTLVMPFIVFMIRGFGYAEKEVGFYAGILTSSLYISQFFSSYIFGRLSDSKGRKPFLVLGLVSNAALIIGFGMSINFWMALAFRSMIGLLNGSASILKCITREIADNTNQSRAFSLRATAWGIGFSLGPIVGGYLSNPNENIGNFFSSFFTRFPYLLPCIFSSLVNVVGAILCIIWFVETKPQKRTVTFEEENENDISLSEFKKEEVIVMTEIEGEKPKPIDPRILRLLQFVSFCQFYNVFAFNDLFNIWAAGDRAHGGLKMESGDLGLAYSVAGISNLTFQALLFTPLERRLTTVLTNKLALIILVPTILFFPHAINKTDNKGLMWFALLSLMILLRLCFTAGNVTNDLMINNASSENPGKINGINGSLQSLGRLLGPIASGSIYALTAFSSKGFPFNYSFMFCFISLTCLINFLASLPLGKELNNRI